MDALTPGNDIHRVIFMKGAQIGGSEALYNAIGYMIDLAPAPILLVQPTVEMARLNSIQRIDPLIENSPSLFDKVGSRRARFGGNTILVKEFPGGLLRIVGANSAAGLRSMSACFLVLDEIDSFVENVGEEGDPLFLAERRTATFANRKIALISTPKIKGRSKIEQEFEQSDKRYYEVPCPSCAKFQRLIFSQLKWEGSDASTVRYECIECRTLIREGNKTKMLEDGKWVATATCPPDVVGFHLSSLYSPVGWYSWQDAVRDYQKAQEDSDLMIVFTNTVEGMPVDLTSEAPDWDKLFSRREDYTFGIVPQKVKFLTAGVDVQKNRLEVQIIGWGRGKEWWVIDYIIIDGDPTKEEVWLHLTEILKKEYEYEGEPYRKIPIRVMAVDSGYLPQDVYAWARNNPQCLHGPAGSAAPSPRSVAVVRGVDKESRQAIFSVSKIDAIAKRQSTHRGVRVWNISAPYCNTILYEWLKLEEDLSSGRSYTPNLGHFPKLSRDYFEQLTSERLVLKTHGGVQKYVWKLIGKRNEALDTWRYAFAAAIIYGLYRFVEKDWDAMDNKLPLQEPEQSVTIKKEAKKVPNKGTSSWVQLDDRW